MMMMMDTGCCCRNLRATSPKCIQTLSSRDYGKTMLFRSPKHLGFNRSVSGGSGRQKILKVIADVQEAPRFVNGYKQKGKKLAEAAEVAWTGMKDVDEFSRFGRLVEGRLVYRQSFALRSYEVGADMSGSIETILNLLQETAVNHAYVGGVCADGFGSTHEMASLNLIWVVTRMQVQVERYPHWGEAVEIDTWIAASGKNSMRRDWLLRDYKTGCIFARATSTWVMMNKVTRRLVKFPEAVKQEIFPYYLERSVIAESNDKKLGKLTEDTAQYILSDLSPKYRDLDINRHVNNVKYVGWILESIPVSILENHELASITLEYRRECGQSHVLQSLTRVDQHNDSNGNKFLSELNCLHLLRLQDNGLEIVKGRTQWRSKLHIS